MKAFLSSTGRDLTKHREKAFHALKGMGLDPDWMDDFHGPGVPIETFDEQRIAECELFVLLIGQLYGTCPEGSEKSYTELEYDTAVALKKPCFLFLSDEAYPLTTIREPDAQDARLRAFRVRAAGLIRNSFTTPDDLATHIVQAIHNWKPIANEPAALMPLPPQPYFAHPYPLQANFTGRLAERRMLTGWLTGGTNVLSLAAIGGMGKSALTWVWLQRDVPLLADSVRPEGVLWWSFYEREATFEAFAREAALYASGGRGGALLTLLAQKRYLLVLDGFEREFRAYAGLNAAYQGDESQSDTDARTCIDHRAARFFRSVASLPMPSRALCVNIDETVLLVVITEQGENRNQCEEHRNLFGFSHGFACCGT